MKTRIIITLATLAASPVFAGWFLDRDNSMIPAEPKIGDAMAVQLGLATATQAIQVCPGVFLATAHGTLFDPYDPHPGRAALAKKRPHTRLIHYPMIKKNLMSVTGVEHFISPRLENASLWKNGNEWSDYAFITVENPLRPEAFVRPLEITSVQMMSMRNELSVHLYRGLPLYPILPDGGIVWGEEARLVERGHTGDLSPFYQVPQKVEQACRVSDDHPHRYADFVSHNCPSEKSSSGSSYISRIDGTYYLVGLNTAGGTRNYLRSDKAVGGSTLRTSSYFCADYERACGQPCAQLEDVLK